MRRLLAPLILATFLAPAAASACGGAGGQHTLTVFAASSLSEAFEELGTAFEAEHAGVAVRFSFASSTALATQVQEGAPADVLASADPGLLETMAANGLVGDPVTFAANSLAVAVYAGTTIQVFADLARPGVRLVLAAPGVPLGDYSRQVLRRAAEGGLGAGFADDVLANLRSDEASARATLAKVELGEADAAIVYGSDFATADDSVRRVEIPPEYNIVTRYAAATTTGTSAAGLADEFIDFLDSERGREILVRWGLAAAVEMPS